MAKVTVKTIGAIVDGHPIGSTIDIDERSVESFVKRGYVEVIDKPKAKAKSGTKGKAATKAKSKAATTKE